MKTNRYSQLFFLLAFLIFVKISNAQEFGITKQEVSRISNTGHNVQVWEVLQDFTRKGEYAISIKHAVAGEVGSFYIIAWADTNDDGKPDKEIGRSDLKTASKDGEWSSWNFKSDFDRIFVGNTWKTSKEKVYYQNGGKVNGYSGLSKTVFYSRKFNGKPSQSTSPRFTNIKIKIIDQAAVFGITKQEVSKISNTGHNVQIWEVLQDFSRKGEYEISIKHAVAGEVGAFYIIAWADTNNDGKPDKEIGRSDLKIASKDGEWSFWNFKSDFDRIFVGNTWKTSKEKVYYQNNGKVDGYSGLSKTVFYSRAFNGKPSQSTSPRFTNIKVKMID